VVAFPSKSPLIGFANVLAPVIVCAVPKVTYVERTLASVSASVKLFKKSTISFHLLILASVSVSLTVSYQSETDFN
jgi:hypothetical protein